eukprot:4913989-Amphidinium_carterae.2
MARYTFHILCSHTHTSRSSKRKHAPLGHCIKKLLHKVLDKASCPVACRWQGSNHLQCNFEVSKGVKLRTPLPFDETVPPSASAATRAVPGGALSTPVHRMPASGRVAHSAILKHGLSSESWFFIVEHSFILQLRIVVRKPQPQLRKVGARD